jgi:hypothetical protein
MDSCSNEVESCPVTTIHYDVQVVHNSSADLLDVLDKHGSGGVSTITAATPSWDAGPVVLPRLRERACFYATQARSSPAIKGA